MYTVYHNDSVIFDPRIENYPLTKPELKHSANLSATFTFTIYPKHPEYDKISPFTSTITIKREGMVCFIGRPRYSKRLFKGGVEWKCEEMISALNDYMMRPENYTGTAEAYITHVISDYASRSGNNIFAKGRVTVSGSLELSTDEYQGHLEALKKNMVDVHGGYLIPRYEDGKIFIDYLNEEDLPISAQPIKFGKNLVDLFIETDTEATYSSLIPLGATDESGNKLTIESVNSGSDAIYISSDIKRETVHEWTDITDASQLLQEARNYLIKNAMKFRKTVKLSAIDLHNADRSVESYGFMNRIVAESALHGMTEIYLLSEDAIPLDSPMAATISLGAVKETFITTVNSTQDVIAVAEGAAKTAQESANAAGTSAAQAATALAKIVGEPGSNAYFILTTDTSDRPAIRVNSSYRFIVDSYDVGETFDEITGGSNA